MNFLLIGSEAGNSATIKLLSNSQFEEHSYYCWAPTLNRQLQENCHHLPATATIADFVRLCGTKKIDLVLLTSENEVQSGIANSLQSLRIPCFGPSRVSSHFRWDKVHFESLILSANLLPLSGLSLEKGDECSKGLFVGMVAHGQVLGVGITPGLCERSTTNIVNRLISEISFVDAAYSGWIVLELVQTSTAVYIGEVRCIPPSDYLIGLSEKSGFDFLGRLRTLLAPVNHDFNVFRQRITQAKEIAI